MIQAPLVLQPVGWVESPLRFREEAPLHGDEGAPDELQAHASFPVERTAIGEESRDTPLGRLDCLRYTVTDRSTVETFWFATAKPGMPIRFVSAVDGQVTSAVTMIGDQ